VQLAIPVFLSQLLLLSCLLLRASQQPCAWASRQADRQVCASSSSYRSQMPSANARWYKVGDALVVLSQGDITSWSGDAIVNAGKPIFLHMPGENAWGMLLLLSKLASFNCLPLWAPSAVTAQGALACVEMRVGNANIQLQFLYTCGMRCLAANERMLGGGGVDGGKYSQETANASTRVRSGVCICK